MSETVESAVPTSNVSRMTHHVFRLLWLFVILASLALYAFALWFGEVNQDEGWYLYAGRLVSEGKRPFIDFASTQGPVMAYVYALAQPLVRLWGVAGGRLFTAILGIATALCAALLTHRIRNSDLRPPTSSPLPISHFAFRMSALLTFSLLGLNLYHVYFTTMVKTYSLAGLFVVLGFLALERALRQGEGGGDQMQSGGKTALIAALLSAALFALAAGVRLSAGILLPTLWLMLLFQWLRGGRQRQGVAVLAGFLLGGSVTLLAIYVPFLFAAPKAMVFGLLEYHGQRAVGALPIQIVYKAGFLIRLAGAYFPLVALFLGLTAVALAKARRLPPSPKPGTRNPALRTSFPPLLYASLIMVTLVHLAAVFPYDDYQVFIMPLLAVVIGYQLSVVSHRFSPIARPLSDPPTSNVSPLTSHLVPSAFRVQLCFLAFCFILLLHTAASPLLQNWLLADRDRIWWPLRSETSLQCLQRTAKTIQNLSSAASPCLGVVAKHEDGCLNPTKRSTPFPVFDLLLTQDTYLAVEAGMRVPPGMELGPFCYFPDMTDAMAASCHVLNRALLQEVLASSEAPLAAFSDYGFAIRCPEITQLPVDEQAELWRVLSSRYEQVSEITPFGQADTALRIFSKK